MVQVEIFDPPMCCPTGLCGPAIDPALLDIQEALLRLRSELDGQVRVDRYALGQQAAIFMQRPAAVARLKAGGVAVLPLTLVDGSLVKERSYPAYAELRAWIDERIAPKAQEAL